jgi:putative membrane protein
MIENYADHAANERTFLAWIRTGIATIAFGFVIERCDLLLRNFANLDPMMDKGVLRQSLGHYDGRVLVLMGITLIGLATIRFARTGKLIDANEKHSVQSVRTELVLSLTLIMAALVAYVALD